MAGTGGTGRELWILNYELGISCKLAAGGGISSEWLISFKISSIIQKIDVILSLQSIGVVFIFLQLQIYKSFALLF